MFIFSEYTFNNILVNKVILISGLLLQQPREKAPYIPLGGILIRNSTANINLKLFLLSDGFMLQNKIF